MIRAARYACCLLALTTTLTTWAQPTSAPDEPLVATFADETITLRALEIAYAHDAGGWANARSDSPAAYDRFLSTYLDYRLKVHAAEAAGYAEKPSLQRQHRQYRLQMIRHRLRTDSVLHPAMRAIRDPLPTSSAARSALRQTVEHRPQTHAAEEAFWRRARNRHAVQIDTLELMRQLGTSTLNSPSHLLQQVLDAQPAPDAHGYSALTVEDLAAFWDARPALYSQPLSEVVDAFLQEGVLDRAARSRMVWDDGFRRAVQRHHDGLLVFELMQDSVWTPALNDTSAQRAYFLAHRDQYKREGDPTLPAMTSANKTKMPVHQVAHSSPEEAASPPVGFEDVRRLVVRDFQAHRERQFVDRLRNRYRAQQYSHPLRNAFRQRPSPTANAIH